MSPPAHTVWRRGCGDDRVASAAICDGGSGDAPGGGSCGRPVGRTVCPARHGRNRPAAIVLDAGHGGEDGGAVSRDGVAESSVNLAITRKLRDVFLFLGRDTVLTREGEEAIYSPDCVTLREKKVSDLKNRVALINQQSGAVLISIHQNSMPDHPSVHGAQVFYNAVSPGGELGMTVQGALNGAVNAGNEKNARAIDSTIYLMKNVRCPAILIECGFLSNPAETQLLLTDEYQVKLAACIAAGLLQYHTEGAKA